MTKEQIEVKARELTEEYYEAMRHDLMPLLPYFIEMAEWVKSEMHCPFYDDKMCVLHKDTKK